MDIDTGPIAFTCCGVCGEQLMRVCIFGTSPSIAYVHARSQRADQCPANIARAGHRHRNAAKRRRRTIRAQGGQA